MVLALAVATTADAKGVLPLEVELTEDRRTYRVSPRDFERAMEPFRIIGWSGVYDASGVRRDPAGKPVAVGFFLFCDDTGLVHSKPEATRHHLATMDYFPETDVAQLTDGPRAGTWVRITPALAGLVDRTLREASPVQPNAEADTGPCDPRRAHQRLATGWLLIGAGAVLVLGLSLLGFALFLFFRTKSLGSLRGP